MYGEISRLALIYSNNLIRIFQKVGRILKLTTQKQNFLEFLKSNKVQVITFS